VRAFIAIDLPEPIHALLALDQQSFRAVCPEARWTRSEGIHLTLKFLGEISNEQVAEVTEALGVLGRFEPFAVDIEGFGFFPNARRPRVFWAGVKAPPALAQLAERVEASMEKLGFSPEQRPYQPHLTLARFQDPRPQPALQELLDRKENASVGHFQASEFFLYESKLSPQGATYRRVARFPR
jgi:2'-5' RNA ligase